MQSQSQKEPQEANKLLRCTFDCYACDMDSARLPYPMCSVNGLLLNGWIPPLQSKRSEVQLLLLSKNSLMHNARQTPEHQPANEWSLLICLHSSSFEPVSTHFTRIAGFLEVAALSELHCQHCRSELTGRSYLCTSQCCDSCDSNNQGSAVSCWTGSPADVGTDMQHRLEVSADGPDEQRAHQVK